MLYIKKYNYTYQKKWFAVRLDEHKTTIEKNKFVSRIYWSWLLWIH